MIAVDIALVLIVVGGVAALMIAAANRRDDRLSARRDVAGSPAYRLTRRMAHELEGVLIQDSNFPFLPNDRRASIEATLKEWEKQL